MFNNIKNQLSRIEERQVAIERSLQLLSNRLDGTERALEDFKHLLNDKSYAAQSVVRDNEQAQIDLRRYLDGLHAGIERGFSAISTNLNHLERSIEVNREEQSESRPVDAEVALRDYSERIRIYEQDLYNKIKSPLLMELISFADRLYKAATSCESEADREVIIQERQAIVGVLHNNNVDAFVSPIGTAFNAEMQAVVNTEETNNEDLDNTVARSVLPGYVWTLPFAGKALKSGGDSPARVQIIMREEQVTLYILKKQ